MTRALLCSGQGRIAGTMLDLLAERPEAAPVLAAARDLLGRDPVALLAEAGETPSFPDRTSQLLCITRALGAAACLGAQGGYVAGYSVGEMAAWSVAGFWDAAQALRLTARRAELMDAADGGSGGLGYVRGLDEAAVAALAAAQDCAIAIRNPDRLFIIGGARDAVARCCEAALAQGAAGARPIAVAVASHTPRLADAVAPFEAVLRAAPVQRIPGAPVLIGAADAAVVPSAERGLGGLARQLSHMVDWSAVLEALVERGVARMLELGPGSALAEMARAAFPALDIRALDDFRTVEGAQAWFARD